MKSKLLKKIRREFEIVKRSEVIRLDGSCKLDNLNKFIKACYKTTKGYQDLINSMSSSKEKKKAFKSYKKIKKELAVDVYVVRQKIERQLHEEYRIYVYNGIFMPYYNYPKLTGFGEKHYKFEFSHLVRISIYLKYLHNEYRDINRFSPDEINDKISAKFHKDKKIKALKIEQNSFTKVWYNK